MVKDNPSSGAAPSTTRPSTTRPSASAPTRADEAGDHALDPRDWPAFRVSAHAALDEMITRMEHVGDGAVWRELPGDIVARFEAPMPRAPRELSGVVDDVFRDIAPYVTGNTHPLFMGWVHGAGTPDGMVAEMIAAGLNANCGGRNHVGLTVERQIATWAAALFDYPIDAASGLFVNGTSMANFLGLLIARQKLLGRAVRFQGLQGQVQGPDAARAASNAGTADSQIAANGGSKSGALTVYTSAQAHGCIAQAMDLAGLGMDYLRAIAVDKNGRMKVDELRAAIVHDRSIGARPLMIVGTAGSVNIGAIDPLNDIADIADEFGLWFHIDGAFGAMAALSSRLKPLLAGISRSHSIAFDFHKWAHVPYDAGFLLVKDGAAHRAAFSDENAYLQRAPRGLAKGDIWPCDLGPDLSRGFRALKTWMTFQSLGADAIARAIENCCANAQYLAQRLTDGGVYELAAPVALNIVCFRLRGALKQDATALGAQDAIALGNQDAIALGEVGRNIVMDLHEAGLAAPSMTTLNGVPAIRAAIVNHRTAPKHIDRFVSDLERLAARYDEPGGAGSAGGATI